METVPDCPKLKRLIPDSLQRPLIDSTKAKQKQSANPNTKAMSWISHYIWFSNPCQMVKMQRRKEKLMIVLERTSLFIYFEKKARVSPPTNSPAPSIMKVIKVSLFSFSAYIEP